MSILDHESPLMGIQLRIGDLLSAADLTLDRLCTLGVPIASDNRLARARRTVLKLSERADNEEDVRVDPIVFAELHRTMLEQFLIVRAIDPRRPEEVQHVAHLLSGSDDPATDTDTRHRDAQFELMIAALLRFGGIVGVHLGEPDIRIPAGAEFLGIAVKRISSPKKLEKRMKQAARQIQRQSQRGLVVLGLDSVADSAARGSESEMVRKATERCRELLAEYNLENDVIGVLGMAMRIRWVESTVSLGAIETKFNLQLIAPEEEHEEVRRRVRLIGRNISRAISREFEYLEALRR